MGCVAVKEVLLSDLAVWERAKAGKIYPAGCTCLQISATKGQLIYLDTAQTVPEKYAVIWPRGTLTGFYLYCLLEANIQDFLKAHQTGLNIQPDVLRWMRVVYHPDPQAQKLIEARLRYQDERIALQQRKVGRMRQVKEGVLQRAFPGEGEDVPQIRFKEFTD